VTPPQFTANIIQGALEQFSSARHHLGFYHNVGISASYTQSSQDPLTVKAAIFSAVAVLINRHPILSAIPIDEDSAHPYFARLPLINLEEAVTFLVRRTPLIDNEKDDELDALLQAQHNTSFKSHYGRLPFWRLIILTNPATENRSEFVACFIFHHALGDGASGMIFHKDFLSALSSSPPSLATTIVTSPNTPLLPNLEALHPLPISLSTSSPSLPGLWSGAKISVPMVSNFRSLIIPAMTTKAFLTACRANGTTITATIPVLIASALSSLLPDHFTDFEACIPVNLRRWLPGSFTKTEEMGVFIDAFSQCYIRSTVSSGFTWDEARRSKAATAEYLKTGGEKVNIAKLKTVSDMRTFFLAKVGYERGSSFDVSNLGVLGLRVGEVDVERNWPGWNMGRMVFSRSAFVTGSAISTGAVTGPDGGLVFGFAWQDGVVEGNLIDGVVEHVKREIERLAHE
jgi:hypothetical protein